MKVVVLWRRVVVVWWKERCFCCHGNQNHKRRATLTQSRSTLSQSRSTLNQSRSTLGTSIKRDASSSQDIQPPGSLQDARPSVTRELSN